MLSKPVCDAPSGCREVCRNTSRSGSCTGRNRSTTAFITLNTAALAPIPRPNVRIGDDGESRRAPELPKRESKVLEHSDLDEPDRASVGIPLLWQRPTIASAHPQLLPVVERDDPVAVLKPAQVAHLREVDDVGAVNPGEALAWEARRQVLEGLAEQVSLAPAWTRTY